MIRNVRLKVTLVEHVDHKPGQSWWSARFGNSPPGEKYNVYQQQKDAINSLLNTIVVYCPVFKANYISPINPKPLLAITNVTQITHQEPAA